MTKIKALRVTVGPWDFQFWPDGDDPGVGIVEIFKGNQRLLTWQATLDEWNSFVEDCS
jgi:hypothetical protein